MAQRNPWSNRAVAWTLLGLAALVAAGGAILHAGSSQRGVASTEASAPPPGAPVPVTTAPTHAPAPFDLSKVMAQVHFAFREDGTGWTGGHTTYSARIDHAAVELTAFHGAAEPAASLAAPIVQGTPIRLGATTASRGDRLLTGPPSPAQRDSGGALALKRGAIVEHLANGAGGLEQSWDFLTRPEGTGDVVVRVPVEGRFSGATASGLHFSSGTLGFVYGNATWVDASGTRTPVRAAWDGAAVVLRLPERLVETSVFPAVLDPLVSPEFGLDQPVYVAATNNQETPALAWNGTNYLAVWIDGRNGGLRDVYGTRISAAGVALEPAGILIATTPDSNSAPAVVSNGADFMVVWVNYPPPGPGSIYGSRVTAAGAALDPTGFPIALGSLNSLDCQSPSVAWSGTSSSYLVVWDELDSAAGNSDVVRGVRVDANKALQGARFAIGPSTGFNSSPSVDWDGSNFLVAWQQQNATLDISGVRISGGGVLQGAPFAISSNAGNEMFPSVAWNGTTHLVAWQQASATPDIFAARVSALGVTTDPAGILISNAAGSQTLPKVSAQGSTGFFVAWSDTRSGSDIYGAQVSSGGVASPAAGILVSGAANNQINPAVASDGTNALVVWADNRVTPPGNLDIYGTRVNAAGTVLTAAGTLYSGAASAQASPAVAFDGTNYLVVWEDRRGPGSDVYGVRVSKAGAVVDPSGFVISAAANNQLAPALTWTGSSYFVVWQDDRATLGNFDIYGARVAASGAVTDPAGILINSAANSQTAPTVAADGTNVLVAWQDERVILTSYDIYGCRVSAAGAPLDGAGGLLISAAPNRQVAPSVAWNGATYFLAWEDLRNSYWDIYGARVAANGTVTDPAGIAIGTGVVYHTHAAVAAVGATFFVVWEDNRDATMNVYGTRVTGAGVVSDWGGIAICTSASDQRAPSVAGDGTNFQVTWQDHRTSTTNWDVYGARIVAATGAKLDGQGFPIATASSDEMTPAIASSGPRSFLVAYKAFNVAPTTNALRVQARTLSNAPPVATAASLSTAEDTALPITLGGTDADGDALTYAVVTAPLHGVLSGTAPALTYTPTLNYNGSDSFTFKTNDSIVDSPDGTISLTITPVNDPPVALAQSISSPEDTVLAVTLTGTDVEGSPLSYTVVNQPTHGSLSGVAPNLGYTPFLNYNGPDGFTFKVNDGTIDSLATATISLTVTPVNDPPVATPQTVSTPEDTGVAITLTGTDVEGSPLTFSVVASPPHGTLTGTPPNLTYTPALNYNGSDAFSFKANDGAADSAISSVSLIVTPVNDPPVAQAQAVGTAQDTPLSMNLVGTDVDLDVLTYVVVSQPTHGTISSGTTAARTYSPATGYRGSDSFTFKVNDGQQDSAVATVSVAVASVNHAPVVQAQTIVVAEDGTANVTVAASDSDGDPLTFTVADPPLHGVVTGAGPAFVYTPAANFNGADSFNVKANDGQLDSALAKLSLTVTPVNDAPVAEPISAIAAHDTPVAVILRGSDVDGDGLTFTVVTPPDHGTLSGSAPDLTYTPTSGFGGADGFTYKVNDGTVDSVAAQVTVVVAGAGTGPGSRDLAGVNGWSCGCNQADAGPGVWTLGALLVFWLRRKPGVALAVAATALLSLAGTAEASGQPPAVGKKAGATVRTRAEAAPASTPAPPPAAPTPASAPPPAAVSTQIAAPSSPAGRPSLAALEVAVTVPNEKLDGAAFTEMLVSAIDQAQLFRVISASEVAAMLGMERQRQLMGCSEESSCLTEVTDALGAQYLLQASVGKVGKNYFVAVRFIDARRSRVLGRSALQTAEPNLLLNTVWKATQQAVDAAAATLPPEESKRWLDRPRQEPAAAIATERARLGVAVTGVAGYQPLAGAGTRGSVGGEVDATWRTGRFDLAAGLVISPSPGARLTVTFALLESRNRVSVGLRGSAFPVSGLYGGGPALLYEFALTQGFGLRAVAGGEVYGGGPGPVVALLCGVGAEAHF